MPHESHVADASIADWLQLIRSEYLEIPDLHLTKKQIEQLWGLDVSTSEALLDSLIKAGFLRLTTAGGYMRADGGR